jgi:hypothetical protein
MASDCPVPTPDPDDFEQSVLSEGGRVLNRQYREALNSGLLRQAWSEVRAWLLSRNLIGLEPKRADVLERLLKRYDELQAREPGAERDLL